jgi:hypothetical protein
VSDRTSTTSEAAKLPVMTTERYLQLKELLTLAITDDKNHKADGNDLSWYLLMGAQAIASQRWLKLMFAKPEPVEPRSWPADTVFIVRYPSGTISGVYRDKAEADRDAALVSDGRTVEPWVARESNTAIVPESLRA